MPIRSHEKSYYVQWSLLSLPNLGTIVRIGGNYDPIVPLYTTGSAAVASTRGSQLQGKDVCE